MRSPMPSFRPLPVLCALALVSAAAPRLAAAYSVNVANESQLRAALYAISNAGDATHKGDVDNTITFTANIGLTQGLWAVNLPTGHGLSQADINLAVDWTRGRALPSAA